MRVDDHKSNNGGGDIWVYDGGEEDSSLVYHTQGQHAERWKEFHGDGEGGDCFALVKREGRATTFPEQVAFVCGVYGVADVEAAVEEPPKARRQRKDGKLTAYVVPAAEGRPLVKHMRLDFADGSKVVWWQDEAGTRSDSRKYVLPEGVKIEELPGCGGGLGSRDPARGDVRDRGDAGG